MGEAHPGAPERHTTARGGRVYRLPLRLFPGLNGYAHLVIADDIVALVDVGSGYLDSDADLEAALEAVRRDFGERVGWDSLTHVLLTHGHIDHFGGLGFVRQRTQAPVGVHELDRPTVMFHHERLAVVAQRLRRFLSEAGVDPRRREDLMDLYLVWKNLYESQPVDFTYRAAGMRVGPLELMHVPGHCPGQVVIRLDDILIAGDQVLPHISPHQAPEVLSPYTGLGHYLESLAKLKPLAAAVRVTLGGHGIPMDDLGSRVEAIEALHAERLERVLTFLEAPMTMAELSDRLFPGASGYHALLAIEETGAHVEHLTQTGAVGLANPEALDDESAEPLRYLRREPSDLAAAVREAGAGRRASARLARGAAPGGAREEHPDVRL
ncbi:MAG TPA: MBL fold metallo-hydrolase [Anaerolineales bacterium]|nr:MBL fold metallo-hydrolase [Anaerolineales bacterium]